jgi:NACalpha-BTF3-like transcription factor
LKLKEIRFPQIFVQLGNLLYPFINTPNQSVSLFSSMASTEPVPRQSTERTATQNRQTTERTNTNESTRNTTTTNNTSVARQDYVQLLVEMGFSRENAVQALVTTNNDLQRATEALIY